MLSGPPELPLRGPALNIVPARMRSLTELYIVSRAADRIAAVVMSTTGATIAWIAVTAIGFIGPAYESSALMPRLGQVSARPGRA